MDIPEGVEDTSVDLEDLQPVEIVTTWEEAEVHLSFQDVQVVGQY